MFTSRAARRCWTRIGFFILTWTAASLAGTAGAEGPAEASRKSITAAIRILKDPALRSLEHKPLQQERLFEVLAEWFDFAEFSKRALAEKWGAFTEPERTEFVEAFSRFLGKYYLGELQKRYTDEQVAVDRQKKHGRWKAYDVSVFGVSAVHVYRAQLMQIMRSHSPAELIALVNSRIE